MGVLTVNSKKGTWVTYKMIQDRTGWNSYELLRARKLNLIEFKKSGKNEYLYNLDSLSDKFIVANNNNVC